MTDTSGSAHRDTPERRASRWSKIDEILEFALAAPPERRDAFLKAACRGNPELRAEVESLLEHVLEGEGLLANLSAALSGGEPTADTGPDELVGRSIGRYTIGERLGGGMAAVYRAEDTLAGLTVVLKLTAPGLKGVELDEARMRLERESFTDQRLTHPAICRVLDSGRTREGRGFLVFEHCPGRTLRERMAEGRLPLGQALSVSRSIASALASAHAIGWIHRDVKPSNVMVSDDGEVKLLDFGVAKIVDEKLTKTGQVLGTLEYMSPEQVSAGPVTPATDIWSLGLVLYEALSGRHPYRRGSRRDTIKAIGRATSIDPHLDNGTPAPLHELVRAMLDPSAEERPSAGEVAASLEAIERAARESS